MCALYTLRSIKKAPKTGCFFCYFLIIQLNKKQQNQYYEKGNPNGHHDLISYNFLHFKRVLDFLNAVKCRKLFDWLSKNTNNLVKFVRNRQQFCKPSALLKSPSYPQITLLSSNHLLILKSPSNFQITF